MPSTKEKAPKSRHAVTGDVFVWNSDDPEVGVVTIPLKFKTKILRKAKDLVDEELEFMFYMLDSVLGDEAAKVDEMDAGEMRAMFSAWQQAWQERAEATFPES